MAPFLYFLSFGNRGQLKDDMLDVVCKNAKGQIWRSQNQALSLRLLA
jgi:hypothetical protein